MDTPADPDLVRFCTEDLPARDRIAILREVFGRQRRRRNPITCASLPAR